MKAIILAGGLGTRLGKYTKNIPKAMLNFKGQSLLERQINTFKSCNIKDIIVVRKYLANKINISNVRYVDETDYNTHMVVGLFQARKEFNQDIIVSYGDILFEKEVLEGAKSSLEKIVGLQIELSIIPLYKNSLTYLEMIDYLDKKGYKLFSIENGFSDPNTGQLLQFDSVFFRR